MICEDSIEHQILHLLGREQALADGLLDGQGDLGTLKMPSSGRAAMIERIEAMMRAPAAAAPRILPPEEAIAEELRRRHGERALLVEAHTSANSRVRLLAVLDLSADALAAEAKRHEARAEQDPAVEVIDPSHMAGREAIGRERPDCARRRPVPCVTSIARANRRSGLRRSGRPWPLAPTEPKRRWQPCRRCGQLAERMRLPN
jgi:hypothetical protein